LGTDCQKVGRGKEDVKLQVISFPQRTRLQDCPL
jgi:hypothetical protein